MQSVSVEFFCLFRDIMTISTSVFFSILTRAEPELKCVKKNADVDVAFIANDDYNRFVARQR